MSQRRGHLGKKTSNVYKLLRCGSGARWKRLAVQHICQMKNVSAELINKINK